MAHAFSLAIADALAPAERRFLLLTIAGTLLLIVALWLGAALLVAAFDLTGLHWLNVAIDVLGSVAALYVAWLVLPSATILMLGFFLDRIIQSIEARHYPDLPPPLAVGIGRSLKSALRLALLGLALNLLALPLYLFFPLVNIAVYFLINGYLVGREYFEAVACRRLEPAPLKGMWRRHRVWLSSAGAVVAFLLSLPLVNLAAPIVGVAFMLHLFERLRRAA